MSGPTGLAADIRAIANDVVESNTSTTKWDPVGDVVAEALHMDPEDVYVATVGGLSRNVGVRLTQSRAARSAEVAAVMWTGGHGEPVDRAVNAAIRACRETPRLTLIFADQGSGMTLVAIVKPKGHPVPNALATEYPAASVFDC